MNEYDYQSFLVCYKTDKKLTAKGEKPILRIYKVHAWMSLDYVNFDGRG